MDRIYENPYVTMSAANARDVGKSFLHPGEPQFRFEIPYLCNGGSLDSIFLTELIRDDAPILVPDVSGIEEICTRAWKTQETLLPPSLTIYSFLQIFWICRSHFGKDGGPRTWEALSQRLGWHRLELREDLESLKVISKQSELSQIATPSLKPKLRQM